MATAFADGMVCAACGSAASESDGLTRLHPTLHILLCLDCARAHAHVPGADADASAGAGGAGASADVDTATGTRKETGKLTKACIVCAEVLWGSQLDDAIPCMRNPAHFTCAE